MLHHIKYFLASATIAGALFSGASSPAGAAPVTTRAVWLDLASDGSDLYVAVYVLPAGDASGAPSQFLLGTESHVTDGVVGDAWLGVFKG